LLKNICCRRIFVAEEFGGDSASPEQLVVACKITYDMLWPFAALSCDKFVVICF